MLELIQSGPQHSDLNSGLLLLVPHPCDEKCGLRKPDLRDRNPGDSELGLLLLLGACEDAPVANEIKMRLCR